MQSLQTTHCSWVQHTNTSHSQLMDNSHKQRGLPWGKQCSLPWLPAAQESNGLLRKTTTCNKSTTISNIINKNVTILKHFVSDLTIIFSIEHSLFFNFEIN
jgi:hypothetical protein